MWRKRSTTETGLQIGHDRLAQLANNWLKRQQRKLRKSGLAKVQYQKENAKLLAHRKQLVEDTFAFEQLALGVRGTDGIDSFNKAMEQARNDRRARAKWLEAERVLGEYE